MNPSDEPALKDAYRRAAATLYGEEGVIEIDPDAPVSLGEEGGAYVQLWAWVAEEALPAR